MRSSKKTQSVIAAWSAVCLLLMTHLCLAEVASRGKPDFNRIKQDIMQRLKTELACVEAAKEEETLRACRPKPPHLNQDRMGQDKLRNGPDSLENNRYRPPEY